MSTAATFTAGLIQMRSGLDPAANLDAAARMIAQAKDAGADYVQTPEMTNILALKREHLLAAIEPEESDPTLAAFRELARKLAPVRPCRIARDQAGVRPRGEPLLPDRPQGRHRCALRQDPHVRRRSGERRKLPRVAQLPSGRDRRGRRPALGAARAHDLLRPALPGALPRAGRGRLLVPRHSVGVHAADRRGALARADARARDRERLLRACGGARRQPRERARQPSATRSWSIPGAGSSPKAASSRASCWRRSIRPRSARRAPRFPRSSMGAASRLVEPMAEPVHLHAVEAPS